MINLDFSAAVAVYVLLFLAIVFLIWMFTKKQKDKDLSLDPRFIWFCSVCTYTYVNTKEEKISICPRCGSYNKK
ncbi:MAG: hypothetical protein ACM3IL_00740 [Deltaproteobacteria bacterium]